MKPDQKEIMQRIKVALGVDTDEQIAQRMACQKSTISNYRANRRQIPLAKVVEIANKTGRSLDWLLTGKTPEPSDTPDDWTFSPQARQYGYLTDFVRESNKFAEIGARTEDFIDWQIGFLQLQLKKVKVQFLKKNRRAG